MCVCVCVCAHAQPLRYVQIFVTQWAATCQVALSMGFSRQQYWSGLLCFPPGDLPNPEIEPAFLTSGGGFFTTSIIWEAHK